MTRNQISYHEMLVEARKAKETERANLAKEYENMRHNVKTEDEAFRHNNYMEGVELAKAVAANTSATGAVLKGIGSIIPL